MNKFSGVLRAPTLEADQNGVIVPLDEYVSQMADIMDGKWKTVRVNKALIRFTTDPMNPCLGNHGFTVIPGRLWGIAIEDGETL